VLGIYIVAAILGAGLLAMSLLAGGGGGHDVDTGAGGDLGVAHDVEVSHPMLADAEHPGFGEAVLSFFRPRNIIFFLAGFGLTGTLLTVIGSRPVFTLLAALGMGSGFFLLSHVVFTFLRRAETGTGALSEAELMGERARVTLPLVPGHPGRVACLLGGREVYLTARLAPGLTEPIPAGREVIVSTVTNGVAEVLPPERYNPELPP
jgi:hypothetical protein